MKRQNQEKPSPFLSLESHFLNTFYAGIYLSGKDMVLIAHAHDIDMPLKSREIILKTLLNTAQDQNKLQGVIADLTSLIQERIKVLTIYAHDFPQAAPFLQTLIQKSSSSALLLARQLKANPYE